MSYSSTTNQTTALWRHALALFTVFICLSPAAYANDDLLLEDDLLGGDDDFSAPTQGVSETSWKDHFVFSLSHDQTRSDADQEEDKTKYLRYAIRIEYEQAIAKGWFARIDTKATSYRSQDKQGQQRAAAKTVLPPGAEYTGPGEAYQRGKLQQAWLQYSRGDCSYKAGQQTLIWGEVDGTFTVDVVTPFDLTEQLLTDYGSIRLPQPMLSSECYFNKQQTQVFYIPRASLHLTDHKDDQFGIKATALAFGLTDPDFDDDEDLGAEWGARYGFAVGKTEIKVMYANLISNFPAQVLALIPDPIDPLDPALATPAIIPTLFDYQLYGLSLNFASGQWIFKSDLAYKTDQIVNGTLGEITDQIAIAAGIEFLSNSNHSINAGVSRSYDIDHEFSSEQNEDKPAFTLSWNKSYLSDDLSISVLANGQEKPRSVSATAQAQYQFDDYWSFSSAVTLVDADDDANNPLISQDNEASLQIKYQF